MSYIQTLDTIKVETPLDSLSDFKKSHFIRAAKQDKRNPDFVNHWLELKDDNKLLPGYG